MSINFSGDDVEDNYLRKPRRMKGVHSQKMRMDGAKGDAHLRRGIARDSISRERFPVPPRPVRLDAGESNSRIIRRIRATAIWRPFQYSVSLNLVTFESSPDLLSIASHHVCFPYPPWILYTKLNLTWTESVPSSGQAAVVEEQPRIACIPCDYTTIRLVCLS